MSITKTIKSPEPVDVVDVLDKTPALNRLAFVTFGLAKFCGIVGIAVGFTGHRVLAGGLLIGDGVLLFMTVLVSMFEMRRQNREDKADVDAVERMLLNGTLKQRLADLGYSPDRS